MSPEYKVFIIALIKAVILSFVGGSILFFGIKEIIKSWKKEKFWFQWLLFSFCSLGIYVVLGIQQTTYLWTEILRVIIVSLIFGAVFRYAFRYIVHFKKEKQYFRLWLLSCIISLAMIVFLKGV
ncbi:MAG: hypothetical protein H7A41_01700 [Chlamydiales bacterium]|nr:hypothetical protein [Chlamydiales bacterium]